VLSHAEWTARASAWLPTDADKALVASLMRPVYEHGKIASWLAPPRNGINGKPFDYEYVHLS
jgi:benzoyl-CoA 2,3-epoxidase subunit B